MKSDSLRLFSHATHHAVPVGLATAALLPSNGWADQVFKLRNPLDWTRPAAEIVLHRQTIQPPKGETVTAVRISGHVFENEYPFQLDDLDGDGKWDELYFQVLIHGNQTLTATIETGPEGSAPTFEPRTDAMADANANPDVTKPAWESRFMTYAAYGAAQVDAIGKIAPKLSIEFLYREPTHSQHGFTTEYGMDFMSVGNTMGAHAPFVVEPDGTINRPWTTDAYVVKGPLKRDARHVSSLVTKGPLRAVVETRIENWKSDLGDYSCTVRYTIGADQRHTGVRVTYDKLPSGERRPGIGAGVRAFREDAHLDESNNRIVVASRNVLERTLAVPWMGRAIVVPDGIAAEPIRIPNRSAPEEIENDGPNYGLVFTGGVTEVSYAFIASWSLDGTITSWAGFQRDVDHLQKELSHPVRIAAVSE